MDQCREVAIEIEKPAAVDIEQIAAHPTLNVERSWISLNRYPRGAVRENPLRPGKAFVGPPPSAQDFRRRIGTSVILVHNILIAFLKLF